MLFSSLSLYFPSKLLMAKVISSPSVRGVAMMLVLGMGFFRESWIFPLKLLT